MAGGRTWLPPSPPTAKVDPEVPSARARGPPRTDVAATKPANRQGPRLGPVARNRTPRPEFSPRGLQTFRDARGDLSAGPVVPTEAPDLALAAPRSRRQVQLPAPRRELARGSSPRTAKDTSSGQAGIPGHRELGQAPHGTRSSPVTAPVLPLRPRQAGPRGQGLSPILRFGWLWWCTPGLRENPKGGRDGPSPREVSKPTLRGWTPEGEFDSLPWPSGVG